MRYLITFIISFLSISSYAQMENYLIRIENKTSFVFTCESFTGEIFTLTQKMSRDIASIMPGNVGTSLIMAGSNGTVTWVDKSKGAEVVLKINKDETGKRKFSTESSHHFAASVNVAECLINGKDLILLELTGNYTYIPVPGILLPNYGDASTILVMPVNISVTGRPADTAWQNAFELILTVPNYFHPSRNGRERYNNEAGRYAGVQYVDAKLTWATQYRVEEGDSIAMIFIQAEKIPEGVPVTVSLIPTYNSSWSPGPKYPVPSRTNGKYYKVFTIEQEPISPHTSSRSKTLGLLYFKCLAIFWNDKLLPMEIITQKNFMEKLPTRPGVEEIKKELFRPSLPMQKQQINNKPVKQQVIKQQ